MLNNRSIWIIFPISIWIILFQDRTSPWSQICDSSCIISAFHLISLVTNIQGHILFREIILLFRHNWAFNCSQWSKCPTGTIHALILNIRQSSNIPVAVLWRKDVLFNTVGGKNQSIFISLPFAVIGKSQFNYLRINIYLVILYTYWVNDRYYLSWNINILLNAMYLDYVVPLL